MAKLKTIYVCQSCGVQHPRWQGQCTSCKAWNSLVEEVVEKKSKKNLNSSRGGSSSRAGGKVVKLGQIKSNAKSRERMKSVSGELDRVLGGGIVPGSVVLVAGEPGIGKSTILTQLALNQAKAREVLYVCGEESVEQVGLRVQRLTKSRSDNQKKRLGLLAELDVDIIIASAEVEKPQVMIVDSIQTLSTSDLSGMAGSVGQVRESANRLIAYAKSSGSAVFIVGHVTKSGSIAGPKVLEHMVDTVLTIEGEKTGLWRILRAYKNRFGPTDEVGVFTMDETGLKDVDNPSGAFLEESQAGKPGSAVIALMEGTRPVLVEVQALAVKSQLAMPRRVAQGININKMQLMCAVLQKYCRLNLGSYDVFVNVAGGLKITEPAADLGVALAIASSVRSKALPRKSVAIGEVGLLGEVRRVNMLNKRQAESKKMGYTKIISPENNTNLAGLVKKFLS